MSQGDSHFRHAKTGSAITVKVVPKASKTEIVEILNDGTVKINLKTPRADVLLRYLAEILNTIPAKLEIVAGSAGIDKLIAILDLDSPTVQERIMRVYTIK
jgi:uncharacterized protein YggU (UPF0235/DUF167 family)